MAASGSWTGGLRAWLARDGVAAALVFWGVLAALLALALVPVAETVLLPFQDAYLHQAIAQALHVLRSGADGPIADTLAAASPLVRPNALYYWVCHVLAYGMSVADATRLVVAAYVVTLPLSLLALFRACGRSRWLVLLVVPFVYNAHMALGFVAWMMATPLYFATVALAMRYLTTPRWGCGVALAVGATLALLAHAQAWLLLVVTVGLLAATAPAERATRGRSLAWLLPSLAVFVPWYLKYFGAEEATAAGIRFFGADRLFGAVWSTPAEFLADVPRYLNTYFRSGIDEALLTATGLLLLVGLALREGPRTAIERGWRAIVWSHRLELVTVLVAVLAVVLPSHIANQFVVRERHLLFAFLLLLGWFPWPSGRRLHALLTAIVALGAGAYLLGVRAEFAAFERRAAPLAGLLALVPPGSAVARVPDDRADDRMSFGALWYLHAYGAVCCGHTTPLWFAKYPGTPVQYREGHVPIEPASRFWDDPAVFGYDALVLRKGHTPGLPGPDPRFRVIGESEEWLVLGVQDRSR